MKPERELLIESLVDLYRAMDQVKDLSQVILRARGFVEQFNGLLASAKRLYPDNTAILVISDTPPVPPGGMAQIPQLSSEAPAKFDEAKLKIKQILNALSVDPTASLPSPVLASGD